MNPLTRALHPENPAELYALLALNNAAVPAVNALTAPELATLIRGARVALAVVAEDSPDIILGFILAFAPGADYASENYLWFSGRGENFLYVDRIVVAEDARSLGLGPVLYRAVFAAAVAAGLAEITCEVNLEPPNPRSLAFHQRLGFHRVGTQSTKNNSVVVALLAADVA
ncbi:GNAT family N-acetyltransferase [Mycetocola spongiae]|uniref:GNAT family N-acetyltransferase n=1 Tax=Mycetocola spongiae TaxID=2859226 RepID=UPI001CF1C14A|nr:GNAT family N-acetyltransferase [Mycetocola spongiae]UCR89734.1 GNAT family N-acetyltransferase [Mycetocola spongiae]